MQFNASKCHILQVTIKKSTITHDYSLGQYTLTVVPSHPYLGIEIDNKLSWKLQIEKNTKNKSIRTINMVRRNFTKGTTTKIRNQIFIGLVRPTLEYGSNVWDPHQTTRIHLLEIVLYCIDGTFALHSCVYTQASLVPLPHRATP